MKTKFCFGLKPPSVNLQRRKQFQRNRTLIVAVIFLALYEFFVRAKLLAFWEHYTSSVFLPSDICRSGASTPGILSNRSNCSPLTLSILGHSKSASTDLFQHLQDDTQGMFRSPTRKEVGCLTGYLDAKTCAAEVNGPSQCEFKGGSFRKLTIDGSPAHMQLDSVQRKGIAPVIASGIQPAAVILLRDPLQVIPALYNHWAVDNGMVEVCERCPISLLVAAELDYLKSLNFSWLLDVNLYRNPKDGLGQMIDKWMEDVVHTFRAHHVPARCRSDDLAQFSYGLQFTYILDMLYSIEILPFASLMDSRQFTIIDFNFYSKHPDRVRDHLLSSLLGTKLYCKMRRKGWYTSWRTTRIENFKPNKTSCAVLTPDLKCEVAAFLDPFNKLLFQLLKYWSDSRMITTLTEARGEWWDSFEFCDGARQSS